MDIQFYHDHLGDNRSKQTIAVSVPTTVSFRRLLADPMMPFFIDIGIAKCSKKDMYDKKKGRTLSVERMEPVAVVLDSLIVDETDREKLYIQMRNVGPKGPKFLAFRVNLKSKRPHFIGA